MRRLALLVVLGFVAAVLSAPLSAVLAGAKTHELKGEVVSVDLTAKTLTFKDEKGDSKTAGVLDKAQETLKTLKAGDKVVITCTDNDAGEHLGISGIKMAKVDKQ